MKKYILSVALSILLSMPTVSADTSVYFGHDHSFRKMEFSESLGKNMLKDNSRHKVLFGGIMLTDVLGVEFGHGVTRFTPHNAGFKRFDIVNGQPICVRGMCNHNVYNSTGKITENYVDLVFKQKTDSVTKLTASAGVSFNKIDISRRLTDFGMFILKDPLYRQHVDYKASLRMSAGFEYMLHDNIGFRNKVTWINTRGLRASARNSKLPDGTHNSECAYKPRDSLLYSVGLFTEF